MGISKGLVMAAAKRDQLATDAPFAGFDAGAFTYLLTQYLWQQTGNESFRRILTQVARQTSGLTKKLGLKPRPLGRL